MARITAPPSTSSGGGGGTTDPATTTAAGIVELATDAETITGTDTTRAVTPSNITAKVASATASGIVELATDAETITGTDAVRATTPASVAAKGTASGKGFVNHGSTAGTARPAGYASVEWYGTVSPSNAVTGDTWISP